MKKKIVLLLVGLLILGTSLQVYASTVLGTNIIDLIKQTIDGIANPIVEDVDEEFDVIINELGYKDELNDYISEKSQQAENDLIGHKDNEVDRAIAELNEYLESVYQEIDSVYQNETNNKKGQITAKVNEEIQNTILDIEKELEKILK